MLRKLFALTFTLLVAPAQVPVIPVGPSSTVAAAPLPSGTISFMIWGDPAEKKAYDDLIAAFTRTYPDARVDLIYTPSLSSYSQRLAVDFVAGTPADVFLINYRRYAHFAATGKIEPLETYVAKSKVIRLEDFYPQSLAPFYWKGTLIAIPQNLSSLVVYYNKNLFDEAKVPYPKSDWTWDDFVNTAKAMTKDMNGDGYREQFGLGSEAILFRTAPFIWQNGGDIVDDPANPKKLTLNSPEAREALQWFVDLQVKHKVVPNMAEEKAEPSVSRFLRGTTAMYFDSRRGVPVYRNISAFDWDVAPLPRGKHPAGILHSDAFFMASASKNKALAWKFIEFANSTEGQTTLARTGRTVPSLIAVAQSPAFLNPEAKPRNSQVFLDVVPYVHAVPVMEFWPDIEAQLSQEVEQAYHGLVPVHEAIRLATERTAEFFPK